MSMEIGEVLFFSFSIANPDKVALNSTLFLSGNIVKGATSFADSTFFLSLLEHRKPLMVPCFGKAFLLEF